MNETINQHTNFKKLKEPKPEDFGLTEDRIAELEKGPPCPFFKIGIIIVVIFTTWLGLTVTLRESDGFSFGNFLALVILLGWFTIPIIAVVIESFSQWILETFFTSFKKIIADFG